jgi:hypothetical protein
MLLHFIKKTDVIRLFDKIAWSDMKSCENVYCMHSKDVHFISVDLPLTDINETIEAWLFDDEGIVIF